MPREKVSSLIGKKGDYVKEVKRTCGTKTHFKEDSGGPQQTLQLEGKLPDVYRAHVMMMKRYHDTERAAAPVQEPAKEAVVSDLQAQLAALQQQLEDAKAKR